MIEVEEIQHSNHGASKAKRWMSCPGSVRMEKDIPDQTSPYAAEGSVAHMIAETVLQGEEYLAEGTMVESRGFQIEVTAEMLEAVKGFVDYVHDRMAQYEDAELLVEQRFDLSPLNPPAPMFGTADVVIWSESERVLEVIDYKHGKGVSVEILGNPQPMYYALGAMLKLRKKPDLIRLAIYQPRSFHAEGPERYTKVLFEDLKAFKQELFAAAEETLDPDAPLAVGSWCRFCKALPVCPAQRKNAVEVAQTEFDVPGAEVDLTPAHALTEEQLALILDRGDEVMDWIKSVYDHAHQTINAGGTIPGWKLVEGRTNRRWRDEEEVITWLRGRGYKNDDIYQPRKLNSPYQIEKLLKKEGYDFEHPRSRWDEKVEKPEGRPKLVRDNHPAPALPSSASQEFDIPSDPQVN